MPDLQKRAEMVKVKLGQAKEAMETSRKKHGHCVSYFSAKRKALKAKTKAKKVKGKSAAVAVSSTQSEAEAKKVPEVLEVTSDPEWETDEES